MVSPRQFAELAVQTGVVQEGAVDDPDGYDGGVTLDRLEAMRRALEERGGWRDPAVELPDDEALVLICAPDLDEPVWLGYRDGGDWRVLMGTDPVVLVTGWQPLPEPMEVV